MDRSNHYEAAFEAYLRDRRLGYVAVDESKRASLDDEPVKSIDFVVYGRDDAKLLVDIKGRKFPGGTPERPRLHWQNWVERADVDGIERWQERFGPEFQGLLVFVYWIASTVQLRRGTADEWCWRGRRYLLRAIPVRHYRQHMRLRSRQWETVYLPTRLFRDLIRPLREFTHPRDFAMELT